MFLCRRPSFFFNDIYIGALWTPLRQRYFFCVYLYLAHYYNNSFNSLPPRVVLDQLLMKQPLKQSIGVPGMIKAWIHRSNAHLCSTVVCWGSSATSYLEEKCLLYNSTWFKQKLEVWFFRNLPIIILCFTLFSLPSSFETFETYIIH